MTDRRRVRPPIRGRWDLLVLLALLALVGRGPSAALAGSCALAQPSAEVLERHALYDSQQPADATIRNWTHGDPQAAAEHAFIAGGPDAAGRVLRVSYRFGPDRRARAGVRASLGGLDASGFDHLQFRVRGEPAAGFARSFEVGFQRPRPDRPDMMENGSYVVAGVGDQWREVRVPLNLMTGIGSWTGLDEFVIAIDSGRADAAEGTLYFDDVALVRTGQPGPSIADPVPTPAKDGWEQAHGGKEAARAAIVARLRGWPGALTVAPPGAGDDRAFLIQIARDTWRGLAAFVDREHGLPVDHVTLGRPGRGRGRAGRRLHQPQQYRPLADVGGRRRAPRPDRPPRHAAPDRAGARKPRAARALRRLLLQLLRHDHARAQHQLRLVGRFRAG